MDIISSLLRSGEINQLKSHVLLYSFEYLTSFNNFNGIVIDDIKNSILESDPDQFSGAEFDLYVALIVESLLQPFIFEDGSIRMKVRSSLKYDSSLFLKEVWNIMTVRGNNLPSNINISKMLQEFYQNIGSRISENPKPPVVSNEPWNSSESVRESKPFVPSRSFGNTAPMPFSLSRSYSSGAYLPPISAPQTRLETKPVVSVERNEYIIKFLAKVRKQGMDILFPQTTHDKVLACIYTSMLMLKSPAHRELIDIVMEIKEAGTFFEPFECESISKTKIRGLLALLKHADILKTKGLEGQPVELVLSPDIQSYRNVREKHDRYIGAFVNENRIIVPKQLYPEIAWTEPIELKARNLNTIIESIRLNYSNLILNVHEKAPSLIESVAPEKLIPSISLPPVSKLSLQGLQFQLSPSRIFPASVAKDGKKSLHMFAQSPTPVELMNEAFNFEPKLAAKTTMEASTSSHPADLLSFNEQASYFPKDSRSSGEFSGRSSSNLSSRSGASSDMGLGFLSSMGERSSMTGGTPSSKSDGYHGNVSFGEASSFMNSLDSSQYTTTSGSSTDSPKLSISIPQIDKHSPPKNATPSPTPQLSSSFLSRSIMSQNVAFSGVHAEMGRHHFMGSPIPSTSGHILHSESFDETFISSLLNDLISSNK